MIHGLLATKGMTCPGHHHSLRTRAGSIPLSSQPQLTRSAENTDNTWDFLGIRDKVLSISPATKSPQSLLRPSNSWEAGQWCASCNGQCNATGRKNGEEKKLSKNRTARARQNSSYRTIHMFLPPLMLSLPPTCTSSRYNISCSDWGFGCDDGWGQVK